MTTKFILIGIPPGIVNTRVALGDVFDGNAIINWVILDCG